MGPEIVEMTMIEYRGVSVILVLNMNQLGISVTPRAAHKKFHGG